MNKNIFFSTVLAFTLFFSCGSAPNAVQTEGETSITQSPAAISNINGAQMFEMMQDTNVVVIDVRTPGEVSGGFIEGTKHFFNINDANFSSNVAALDKSKKYVIYCASGRRSMSAASAMQQMGFNSLYNLNGGIGSFRGNIVR